MAHLHKNDHHDHIHMKQQIKATPPKKNKKKFKLPTTVLCGFLGSGKTTLLNYILNNRQGYKVAVIVNDMSEISIDAASVQNGQAVFKRTEEKMVELSNGCICCTLRTDLVKEVSKLAKKGKFDYLLIESTGMAEPLPIAQAFSFETEQGKTLYDIAKIDTMVTVVDAFNFFKELGSIETHQEVKSTGNNEEMEEVPIAQLFIDQIEFANVIIINKLDLVDDEQLRAVEQLIKKLNPGAEILHAKNSVVPLQKVLMTKKFDFEEAQNSAKWIEELAKTTPSSEVEEYGFSSFAFKSRRPFNPEKLHELMCDPECFKDVVRAKGFVWIATNMVICGSINIVSGIRTLEPETVWWAAIKKSKWGENKQEIDLVKRTIKSVWDPVYGDRRNEMVFIGRNLNKETIVSRLEACLITEEEFKLGQVQWKKMFNDKFSKWVKAAEMHPLKENFKYVEDEWEECDTEDESDFDPAEVSDNLDKTKSSANSDGQENSESEESQMNESVNESAANSENIQNKKQKKN